MKFNSNKRNNNKMNNDNKKKTKISNKEET